MAFLSIVSSRRACATLACAAIVVVSPASAWAETADEALDSVIVLMEDNRLSEALRVVNSAMKKFPDEPNLVAVHGSLLTTVCDFVAARAELVRALQIDEENALTPYYFAILAWTQGQIGEARAHLDKAVELFPEEAPELDRLDALVSLEERSTAGVGREFAEGSPQAFVQAFLTRLKRGAAVDAIVEDTDPKAIAELADVFTLPRERRPASQRHVAQLVVSRFGPQVAKRYRAHEVEDAAAATDDTGNALREVTVRLIMRRYSDVNVIRTIRAMLASGESLPGQTTGSIIEVARGLEPEDREAYYRRVVHVAQVQDRRVVFQLRQVSKRWVIVDLRMPDGKSLTATMRAGRKIGEKHGTLPKQKPFRIGTTTRILVGLLVAVIFAGFARWKKRRSANARATPRKVDR